MSIGSFTNLLNGITYIFKWCRRMSLYAKIAEEKLNSVKINPQLNKRTKEFEVSHVYFLQISRKAKLILCGRGEGVKEFDNVHYLHIFNTGDLDFDISLEYSDEPGNTAIVVTGWENLVPTCFKARYNYDTYTLEVTG